MFGNCRLMGNGSSIATSKVEDKANASAAMNFINVAIPMCGTFIIALIPGSPIVKLPLSFLIAMIIMISTWFYLNSFTSCEKQSSL
ncbi:hypothetical protein [Legionella santicrucis]|uniref:hypothetical protein n=1 Tax=Legionella santicrucis TaxID=45074 RepID=UPI001054F931|nr:hypothetical protein [Legionella santicrucis]